MIGEKSNFESGEFQEQKQVDSTIGAPRISEKEFKRLETKRKVATETGRFYNSIIDCFLETETLEERRQRISELLESLPGPMRKLYKKGLDRFQEELKENHLLLEQHRGDEIKYLLTRVMVSDGKSQEEIDEVLQNIDAKFAEPSSGVAIIDAEKDFFRLLKQHNLFHAEGGAVHFGSSGRSEPSFLIVQRLSLQKSLAEDSSRAARDSSVRHEFHHFIWNFLERRGDYLRKASESVPESQLQELANAFGQFRNEIMAYIIEERAGIGGIESDVLTYSKDRKILALSDDARDIAAMCLRIAKQQGINSQNFLYAAMTSRNFEEIKNNFIDLLPLEKIDQENITALYCGAGATPKIAELLNRKRITIPANLLEDFGLQQMLSPNLTRVDGVLSKMDSIKKFAEAVGVKEIDDGALVEKVIRLRLPLPEETVKVVLSLPSKQLKEVPLDKSPEDFLKSFVSFWHVNNESLRIIYKQIIDSSLVMREAFDNVKNQIINNTANMWRRELKSSSDERKQRLEKEIQENTELFLKL